MFRIFVASLCLFLLPIIGHAQYDGEDVFVDLNGDALKTALIQDYKSFNMLSYGDARDVVFGEIDIVNDTLTCVYTGYQVYLDPALDPTTTAFAQDVNTEHTFPRSKGADDFTLGHSDMHHLYPTLADANSARGNLPFAEILDSNTDEWFRNKSVRTSIPTSNIDEYSEYRQNVAFEPREDHKGNVARSYFYFYTMYQNEADIADPNFFESQRAAMCEWHFADPVDKREWNRSKNIAAVQGNENPFILDCRLARLYCDDITQACMTVDVDDLSGTQSISVTSIADRLKISGHSTDSYLAIANPLGQIVAHSILPSEETLIDISHLDHGIYFVIIMGDNAKMHTTKIIR